MAAELPQQPRDLRSTSTSSKELRDMFFSDRVYTLNVQIDGEPFDILSLGNSNMFFYATPIDLKKSKDPMSDLIEKSCIHLYNAKSKNIKTPEKIVLYLESFYDVPNEIKESCTQHRKTKGSPILFDLFDFIADDIGYDTIELVDGSNVTLPDGRKWNLRILNNILRKGRTYYEQFGFKAIYPVQSFKKIRITLYPIKDYIVKNIGDFDKVTLLDVIQHLYETEGVENPDPTGPKLWSEEDKAVMDYIIHSIDEYISETHKGKEIITNAYERKIGNSLFSSYEINGNIINFFTTKGGKKTKRKTKHKTRKINNFLKSARYNR